MYKEGIRLPDNFDVLILGSGPAGATLARLLDPKLKVAILDKKDPIHPDQGFHKPCGGLLAPDAQKIMAKQGLSFPLKLLVEPQIFAVRTIDVHTKQMRHYQRFYLNFDRHAFDLWLSSLIPKSVTILNQARCTQLSKIPTGYAVTYQQHGQQKTLHTKYLVGADGANSLVRKTFIPRKVTQYVCIQQWFKTKNNLPFYSAFFDSRITDCYGWLTVKNEYSIFGVALAPEKARENFEKLKQELAQLGYCFENLVKTEGCLVNRPTSLREITTGQQGVFLVGEAAGLVSPSSLEGISYAIESASILSRALNLHFNDPLPYYSRHFFRLKLKILGKLLKNPFMYWPWLRSIVMKSGLASIQLEDIRHIAEKKDKIQYRRKDHNTDN